MGMPIPREVKDCVVFIYVKDANGKIVPNGTGFLVSVPDVTKKDRAFGYLVTAAHVLRPKSGAAPYPEVFVRLNHHQGGASLERVPITPNGGATSVFFHEDARVDLGAIPFVPDQTKYRFKVIPAALLPASADNTDDPQVSEGADVFFAGLFMPHIGDTANFPIVRFGRVALTLNEAIPWDGVARELLLVECASYGGNSGAPVFYYLGAERSPGTLTVGTPVLKLAGVMMGAYQDVRPVQTVETSTVAVSTSNLGIAAVVPARKLRELLESAPLATQRALAGIQGGP